MTGHWLSVLSVLSTWGQTFYEINDSSIRFWKDNPQFLNGSSDMLVLSASKSSLDVNIEVIRSTAANAPIRNSCQSCQGLVGVFQVAGGPYAAVIIDSAECDDIGPGVRRIKELGLMKVPSMDRPVSSKQLHAVLAHEEAQRLLREAFAEHSFYFSTQPERFDVTRNTQSNAVSQLQHQTYLVENCDPRFFWNRKLAASIVAAGAGSLVVPISNIWTDTIPIAVSTDAQHNLTLVSRRSRLRQGPRLRCLKDQYHFVCAHIYTSSVHFL